MNIEVIKSRLVSYNNVGEVRHNMKKVAATVFSLLLDIEEKKGGVIKCHSLLKRKKN